MADEQPTVTVQTPISLALCIHMMETLGTTPGERRSLTFMLGGKRYEFEKANITLAPECDCEDMA